MTQARLLRESPCFMTIQPSLRARWTKPRWHFAKRVTPRKQTACRTSCANVIQITSAGDRSARLQLLARFLNLVGDQLFIGQDRAVFSRQNFVRQPVKRVTRDRFILLAAKNEADRRVFAVMRPMFARIVEIHVHLASVSMSELAAFEINHDKTA